MERLTHKIVYDNEHCQYMFDIDQDSEVGTKLGELEDILESWHIENLEELKTRLHDCQVYHLKNNSNETLIYNLKSELAELKQKAIVPKFRIGQEVFIIIQDVIRATSINSFRVFENNELSYYCKYVDGERMYLELDEEEIFATKEEAEQKLAEIKGE